MEKPSISSYNAPKPVKIHKPTKPAPLAINQPNGRVKTGDDLFFDDMHQDAKKLWDYMQQYLPRSLSTVRDPAVLNLFRLPRVRALKWRKTWYHDPLFDNDWRQIAGFIIHLVGVEKDSLKCCTFCRRGEGPFEGCQVLPPQAPYDSHKLLPSCANCIFIHRRDHCSIKSSWEGRCGSRSEPPISTDPPIAQWAAATATSSSDGMKAVGDISSSNKRSHSVVSDDEQEEQRASRRRSERIQVRPSVAEAKAEPARKLVTFPIFSKDKQASVTGASRGSDTPLIAPGQTTPDGLLEMEEWEIAPGRIRETGIEKPNSERKLSYLIPYPIPPSLALYLAHLTCCLDCAN